jgi:hypothetical protein
VKTIRIIEALPEENLIFPDTLAAEFPESPFPDFCCLDCQHLETAFRKPFVEDDPCLQCSKGKKKEFTSGDEP